jgi:hypothetical protein
VPGVTCPRCATCAPWYEPLAFGLFAGWAGLGFAVDYLRRAEWRSPPLWPVFVPYVGLFIVSLFAFWMPLWSTGPGPWFAFGLLYALHTGLNLASHRRLGRAQAAGQGT